MPAPPIVSSILQAVGNTPVVKLRKLASPAGADVLVKLEYYNPTGSYKDRMAVGQIVATVAVDTGLKYLAGDLFTS